MHINEPARRVPVYGEFDLCVLGGSCTGVFAAVRAAREGLRVCIVEKQNCFGGVATSGLVNVWHSLKDTVGQKQIIAGLTQEVIDRLEKRSAAASVGSASVGFYLNTEELKIELDELVTSSGITPVLHTMFVAPHIAGGKLEAVVIENKSGRQAIKAGVFIDATGDGDLAAACGVPYSYGEHLQPPTTCAKILGMSSLEAGKMFQQYRQEFDLAEDAGWVGKMPDNEQVRMYALTHCFGTNAAIADELTAAEIEGRRHIRAIMDMARKYGKLDSPPVLMSLPSHIGIRETRRFESDYVLSEDDVLTGRRFDDAVANGSYRVDVHHPSGGGFVFKYLDGTQTDCRYGKSVAGRWRDPLPDGQGDPTFYQMRYSMMTHREHPNLIMAGRMVGTDRGAFGAVRVMVNLNQLGEAAGTAAAIALDSAVAASDVNAAQLREKLTNGGSLII